MCNTKVKKRILRVVFDIIIHSSVSFGRQVTVTGLQFTETKQITKLVSVKSIAFQRHKNFTGYFVILI